MKKALILTAICSAITLCFLFCDNGSEPEPQKTIADFLPTENAITGWVYETDNTCFSGMSKTSTELFDIIDGGADKYIDNGYTEAAFKGYFDGTVYVCTYIYNQGSNSGAKTVYNHPDIAIGEYESVSGIGELARIDTSNAFSYTLDIVTDKYYITIFSSEQNSTVKATLKSFGTYIINQIAKD